MRKFKKYLFLLAGLAIIIVVLSWFWLFRKADESVKNSKAQFEIEAAQIIDQFESDENSANQQYLGKVIIISGILESIQEAESDYSLYLRNENDMSGVLCSFNKSAIDISKLETGTSIKIKGICTGYLIDVVLNKCVIVE